jgi:hypothetical protein
LSAVAPKSSQLRDAYRLPEEIHFFVSVSHWYESASLPPAAYMRRAKLMGEHEAAGPCFAMAFTPANVLGLQSHHIVDGKCTAQLCLHVPVTKKVNNTLQPTRLKFQPSNIYELHGAQHLPRLIVPITAITLLGATSSDLVKLKRVRNGMLKQLISPWEGAVRASPPTHSLPRTLHPLLSSPARPAVRVRPCSLCTYTHITAPRDRRCAHPCTRVHHWLMPAIQAPPSHAYRRT